MQFKKVKEYVVTVDGQNGKYSGYINKRGQPHGNGIFVYSNFDRYDGEFKHGRRDGSGKIYYVTAAIEDGSWQNDLRHGYCIVHNKDGTGKAAYWFLGQKICDMPYPALQTMVSAQNTESALSNSKISKEPKTTSLINNRLPKINNNTLGNNISRQELAGILDYLTEAPHSEPKSTRKSSRNKIAPEQIEVNKPSKFDDPIKKLYFAGRPAKYDTIKRKLNSQDYGSYVDTNVILGKINNQEYITYYSGCRVLNKTEGVDEVGLVFDYNMDINNNRHACYCIWMDKSKLNIWRYDDTNGDQVYSTNIDETRYNLNNKYLKNLARKYKNGLSVEDVLSNPDIKQLFLKMTGCEHEAELRLIFGLQKLDVKRKLNALSSDNEVSCVNSDFDFDTNTNEKLPEKRILTHKQLSKEKIGDKKISRVNSISDLSFSDGLTSPENETWLNRVGQSDSSRLSINDPSKSQDDTKVATSNNVRTSIFGVSSSAFRLYRKGSELGFTGDL